MRECLASDQCSGGAASKLGRSAHVVVFVLFLLSPTAPSASSAPARHTPTHCDRPRGADPIARTSVVMSHVASTPTPSLDPTPSVAPVMPAPSSNWRAPLCSLRSAAFGVAGSVAAKLALTDSWTHWIADHIADAWRANALTSSSPAEASDQQIETDEWNKQVSSVDLHLRVAIARLS